MAEQLGGSVIDKNLPNLMQKSTPYIENSLITASERAKSWREMSTEQ